MGLSLKNIGKKIWDQANVFDNGRTYKNSTPTNTRSILGQTTHNAVTNTVGNFVAKPVAAVVSNSIVEPSRSLIAQATGNKAAFKAAEDRKIASIKVTPWGQAAEMGYKIGTAPGDLAAATINDIKGNKDLAKISRNEVLKSFNATPVGQVVSIPARNMATAQVRRDLPNLTKERQKEETAKNLESTGLDPNASLGKQLTDTLGSAAAIAGGLKALERGARPTANPRYIVKETKQLGAREFVGEKPVDSVPAFIRKPVVTAKEAYQAERAKARGTVPDANSPLDVPSFKRQGKLTAEQQVIENARLNATSAIQHGLNQVDNQTKGIIDSHNRVADANRPVVQLAEMPTEAPRTPFMKALDEQVNKTAEVKQKPVANPKVKAANPLDMPAFEKPTNIPKTPGAVDRAVISVRGALDRMGTGGKEYVKRFQEHRAASEQGQAAFFESVPTVKKLGKKDFTTFVDTLESLSKGETPVMSPKIAQAVNEWSSNITKVQERAIAAGKEVGDRGPYYFPRNYEAAFKPGQLNKTIQHLIDTGQAVDVGDALSKIEFMKQNKRPTFGHLDKTREFDLPDYDKTHNALTNYISGAYDNITKAEQFGAKGELTAEILQRMSKEGYDTSVAQKLIKTAQGENEYNRTSQAISGGIRQVEGYTKLGNAGITNAGQSVNTIATEGAANTIISGAKLFKKETRDLLHESGVLNDSTIAKTSAGGLGVKGWMATNIASPGFALVEKFNRMLAGEAGSNSAIKLAARGDAKAIAKLRDKYGITGTIGKTLTKEQKIQAIRSTVEKTQFKVDAFDLPQWADTPGGKVVSQFKTFGYKQSGFIYNELVKEALKGNAAPLARFIATGVPVGVAQLKAKGMITGNSPFTNQQTGEEDSMLKQAIKGVRATGGAGLADNALFLGENAKSDRLPQYVAGTLGGPAAGDIAETATNIGKGAKGDWTAAGRQAISKVPVVGKRLANELLPYDNSATKTAAKISSGDTGTDTKKTPAELDKEATEQLKKMKEDVKAGDNALIQLPNGRYAATINGEIKTFDKLDKARDAARKDHALADGSNSKVLGEKGKEIFYYKDENGETKSMPNYKHTFDIADSQNQLDMYMAKENEDLGAWSQAAKSQLKALETLKNKYNKDSQADKVDDIQKKIETLKVSIAKYAGYGGFKKGGGGSSIKPSSYGVSTNTYNALKIGSGGSGSSAPRIALRARSTGSKPKVTMKRLRV